MKKLFLSMMLLALPILASAYDCQVDGIYYNLNPEEKTAEVTYQKMISYNNPQSDYSGSVTIPEKFTYDGVEYSVTSIGERAFLNCSGLTSMSIGNSVTSIGGFAFHNCSSLTSVTIPNSVTSIGENAFAFCSGLSSIILETGNTIFDSRDNCNAIIETNSNTLIVGCKNTVIPSSVTRIGDKAFCGCSGLTTVTIPSSVSSIGWYAFCGCSSLTSVTIPNSVTSIEQGAFDGCNALTSVTIPNSVTSIGLDAFNGCTGLTSVHITDLEAWCKISFIDDTSNPLSYAHHLYLNGEEIKDLVIPNLLKSIVRNSFVGCSGLTSITIPNSVTIIEKRAFVSCSSLTSVTIPNSVTSIGVNAFAFCSSLTSVTIPNSVTSIGGGAFYDCNGLTSVFSEMEKPCNIDERCFPEGVFNNATLFVPKGTIDKYKSTDFWNKFVNFEERETGGTVIPDDKKCSTPTISYSNKKLTFFCATEGAQCLYTITDSDIKTDLVNEVSLSATYEISVYATKSGYTNSDVATATLVWTDAIFTETTPETPSSAKAVQESIPVLISAKGGNISVRCEADGQEVNVYTIDGLSLGTATVKNGEALVSTSIPSGDIAVVKVGGRSVKVIMR